MHPHINLKASVSKNQLAIQQQLKDIYRQASATGDTEELDLQILKKSINKAALIKALISLIIIYNLSFYIVE